LEFHDYNVSTSATAATINSLLQWAAYDKTKGTDFGLILGWNNEKSCFSKAEMESSFQNRITKSFSLL